MKSSSSPLQPISIHDSSLMIDCHISPPQCDGQQQQQQKSSKAISFGLKQILIKMMIMLPSSSSSAAAAMFYGHLLTGLLLVVIVGYQSILVNCEHRAGSYRRNQQQQALYRAPCSQTTDCPFDNTQCNLVSKKCQCKPNFVQVDSFVNRSYITHLAMTCLHVAQLDERCISDIQCIVDYSECQLTVENVAGGINRTIHMCKCISGHELKHDQATVIIDGQPHRVRPICDPDNDRTNSSSWLITVVLISILVLVILIGTFVLIVRYQRLRQPYNQQTITSLTSQGGINSSHQMGQHHPLGSSSPPPMGSAEAEFQNDFIQVFPMHHLEPMPDKNVHAYIIK